MNNGKKYSLVAGIAITGLVITSVTLLKAIPVFDYATWLIDEECIVRFSVGYLGGELNPHWTGYYPLPSYILGIIFGVLYLLLRSFQLVGSGAEYASWLFSDHGFFFITARLLFGAAYTGGCAILAYIIQKRYQSWAFAAVFFFIALFLPDAVAASLRVRVDSFVFFFVALVVYFSCFSEKTLLNFLLAIVFCAGAIASKIPAIVFAPILFLVFAYDVYKKRYPAHYLVIYLALLPLLMFAFMPYVFLDSEALIRQMGSVATRVSGSGVHLGKTHNLDVLAKAAAPWRALAGQVGFVSIGASVLIALWGVFRDSRLTLAFLFPAVYLVIFSTSAVLEPYWLRPVYPFFVFFAFIFFLDVIQKAIRWIESAEREPRTDRLITTGLKGVTLVFLLLYGAAVVDTKEGIRVYTKRLLNSGQDSRLLAGDYIFQCLPDNARIVVETNWLPHYLPTVYSADRDATLENFGYCYPYKSWMVMRGFDYYFKENKSKDRGFRVTLLNAKKQGYDMDMMDIPAGSFVVTSSRIYGRYFLPQSMQLKPELTANAMAFHEWLRQQTPVRSFSGRGGTIEIWYIPGEDADPGEQIELSPSCGWGGAD